jgi:hypothetical protein
MVEHGADVVRLQPDPEFWCAAGLANFIDLLPASQQSEAAVAPKIDNLCRHAVGGEQSTDEDVAIEQDQH